MDKYNQKNGRVAAPPPHLDDIPGTFGLRVRAERKRQGLTIEKLAEKSNTSVDVIKRVEKGLGTKVDAAYNIANALGTTLDSLLEFSVEDSTVSPDRIMENLRALEKSIKEMFRLGE